MRDCPFCQSRIPSTALVCRYCTRNVGGFMAPATRSTVVIVVLFVITCILGMCHLNKP